MCHCFLARWQCTWAKQLIRSKDLDFASWFQFFISCFFALTAPGPVARPNITAPACGRGDCSLRGIQKVRRAESARILIFCSRARPLMTGRRSTRLYLLKVLPFLNPCPRQATQQLALKTWEHFNRVQCARVCACVCVSVTLSMWFCSGKWPWFSSLLLLNINSVRFLCAQTCFHLRPMSHMGVIVYLGLPFPPDNAGRVFRNSLNESSFDSALLRPHPPVGSSWALKGPSCGHPFIAGAGTDT